MLYALGCGLADAEIADALSLPERAVAGQLGRLLVKLGLPDRAAAIVHAFDCGLVVPGQGPRRRTAPATTGNGRTGAGANLGTGTAPDTGRGLAPGTSGGTGTGTDTGTSTGTSGGTGTGTDTDTGTGTGTPADARLRVCVLGPLRARLGGRSVDVGPVRQQAVLAALALSLGRSVSRQALLDGVWGMESPGANVVPVYVYRLRKGLRLGECADSVIGRDRYGYRLVRDAVEVDVTCMEDLVSAAEAAERAGDGGEAVRLYGRALELFRGEPLAGLPGPLAELERLRLIERRVALAYRRAHWQLGLERVADAIAGLSALAVDQPLNEPVAALLMSALHRAGRRAEALAVFERTGRRLATELGVTPGEPLRRARWSILRGDETDRGRAGAA